MPGKNIVKVYVENGYYHIYNRGVEKRKIFKDTVDYKTFLKYLKESLMPPPDQNSLKTIFTLKGGTFKGIPRQPQNFNKEISMISFCLMPNHFHFLIKQNSKNGINKFMQSVLTRYSMYFNKKYSRVGKLFQGHYKAVLIKDESYLLHLSRYIHLNPSEITGDIESAFSSYQEYLNKRKIKWIHPEQILAFFNQKTLPEFTKTLTYKNFVENYKNDPKLILGDLTLE